MSLTQWFSATLPAEQYGHQDSLLRLGIQQSMHRWDYQLELLQAAELFLPTDAVSPVTAQGQLGLGGTYYASNSLLSLGLYYSHVFGKTVVASIYPAQRDSN